MTGPSEGESGGVREGVSFRVTTIFNIMSDNTKTLYGRKIMIEKKSHNIHNSVWFRIVLLLKFDL